MFPLPLDILSIYFWVMEEKSIGSYNVLKKIGAGGMAKVYLAVHKDIPNLKVVLKILSDPNLVERFKQEADKLALLDAHPNICRIKHFFNHGEEMVIAMEYIDGSTLDEKIKESGKISIQESLRIISEVLDILDFAHQKGIYHRDIKPSNIMVDKTDRVKIIDFGIAKAKTDPNLTTVGTACGTPAYMAPEQFVPSDQTDYAKIDIYAVGTTLYFMLTGKLPFKGDNEFAIRDAKLFTSPIKPRDVNPDIPKPLEEIILKSLKKEPKDRFASSAEMKKEIDTFRQKISAETVLVKPDGQKPPPKPVSKIIIAGILSGLALVAILIFIFSHGKEEKKSTSTTDSSAVKVTQTTRPTDTTVAPQVKPTGKLQISVFPSGDIYVDNVLSARQSNSALATADTGVHYIRIENHQSIEKQILDTIILAAGQNLRQDYTLHFPEKTAQHPDTQPKITPEALGVVIIGSKPQGAQIFIDGTLQRQQTNYTFKLKTGTHTIRVKLGSENSPRDTMLNIAENDTSRVIFNLEN